MATSYPGGLDVFDETSTPEDTPLGEAGDSSPARIHSEHHRDLGDAVEAIEANAVKKQDYNANTILVATADDTPAPMTVAASRIVGRKATGDIDDLTPAETKTILGLDQKAYVSLPSATTVTGDGSEHDVTGLTTGSISLTAGDYMVEAKVALNAGVSAYAYVRLYEDATIIDQWFFPQINTVDKIQARLGRKRTLDGNAHTFKVVIIGSAGTVAVGAVTGGTAGETWIRVSPA